MVNKNIVFAGGLAALFLLMLVSPASAGLISWIKGSINGRAVGSLDMNITLGNGNAPQIYKVYNNSGENGPVTLTAGPTNTSVRINFTVSDADGYVNLDMNSARVNLSRVGEKLRYVTNCTKFQSSGNEMNFTCAINMSWYDAAGLWNISINISDVNGNRAVNGSTLFSIGSLSGFSSGPGNLTFSAMSPGSVNITDNVDGILLNNTGNTALNTIDLNVTNLRGETNTAQAIYSGNFSASNTSVTNSECNIATTASRMNDTSATYATITNATLAAGNFQYNNKTGQVNLYICALQVGSELSSQAYSTSGLGSWTIRGL